MTAGDEGEGSTPLPPGLLAWLRNAYGDPALEVSRYEKLAGGAIQQNLALDLVRGGAPDGGGGEERVEALVLRTDAASGVSVSRSRAQEHALLSAAFDAGVTVPEPLALCTDPGVSGRPFFLMRRVAGITHPVHLTRGDALGDDERDPLVEALGAELARIHAVPLDDPRIAFLHDERDAPETATGGDDEASAGDGGGGGDGSTSGVRDTTGTEGRRPAFASHVARYRALLDELGAHRPVLEWALAWLAHQRPPVADPTLCHHDFRTGNLMVERAGAVRVSGVLDWEFAAIGDPHEDIGWFCAPCWRFASREREAGGLGSREAFYRGYERASGRTIERTSVPLWEIVATVRWAVIALQQGARFTSGAETTLELGLTGRMIAELEQDVLELVTAAAGVALPGNDATDGTRGREEAGPGTPPLVDDAPSASALLASARETLLEELLPTLAPERRYTGLMIANAIGIAGREVARRVPSGERPAVNAELVERLRALDADALFEPALLERLAHDTSGRLAVANPKRAGAASRPA